MVWPCFKVFLFSKDNTTGHSERKKKKRQTEEDVGRQYQRVDRNGLCQLSLGSLKQDKLKSIVANSSVVPRRHSKIISVTHKTVRPGARPHGPPVMAEGDFRLMTPLYDNLQ